jgi:hypothetical protein
LIASDWAQTSAPREYLLPADREALVGRYAPDRPSLQFATLLDYVDEHGADRVYAESPYVDFDYRAEYSNLYARGFNPPPDKCERLLFFRDEEFLGFCVVRPTYKPVGRTALKPPPTLAEHVTCKAKHAVRPYGLHLEVEGWPFVSQDGVYGRCAHAAIWSISRYHHLRHSGPKHSLAGIVEAAETPGITDKTSRSAGLYLHEVAAAFAGLGLPTIPYQPNGRHDLEATLCRYLNSGLPIALSTPGHLTVLVGYGHEENGDLFFVRSDDNTGAYEKIKAELSGAQKWGMLLVPMPARILVPGAAAEIKARLAFAEQAGATVETEPTLEAIMSDKLRYRTYAIDAAEYKAELTERGLGEEVVNHHQLVPASVWIWVTEFQLRDVSGGRRVVGELAIDATSDPRDPQPLFANLPGRVVSWLPGEANPKAKSVPDGGLYDSGIGFHRDPSHGSRTR